MARYSTQAFDAVGNGGLMYVTMYVCLMGMADGAQIIFSRRIGENSYSLIGQVLGSSLFIGLCLVLILFLILQSVIPQILYHYSNSLQIAKLQNDFLHFRSFSLFFACIIVCIQAFFLALGKTKIVLYASLITASVNILMDYILIFGHFGFPELGHIGAAIASNLADFSAMCFLIISFISFKDKKQFEFFSSIKINKSAILSLTKVGFPLLFQSFIALATWTIFFTLIEMKGEFSLTVSQNIRSIYFLAFVPIWGFAGTTKTYISQYIGANKWTEIPVIQRKIQLLSFLFTLVFFHGAILYPETLIRLINPNELYIEKSASILQLVAGSILIYGFISVYFQTIHSSGNTIHSMLIEISTVIIYGFFSVLFILFWDLDIYWVWTVEYIYFISIGILSIMYLRLADWKSKSI